MSVVRRGVCAAHSPAPILLPAVLGRVAARLYRGDSKPETRKVPCPSYDELMTDLQSLSCVAVGREYGVSDNAIRRWIRWY